MLGFLLFIIGLGLFVFWDFFCYIDQKREKFIEQQLINDMKRYKEKKYNYIYVIINLVNNKIYYGIYLIDDLNDGYMGLGILLV